MNRPLNWLLSALLVFVVSIAAGCGGGGPSSGAGAAPAAAKEVTGVAATGAPIAQGVIYLKDSSDTPVELHQTTRSDGSFTFNASGLKAPFFLKAGSNNRYLYSIATDFGMTNITPLTGIVVAQAAQKDDLDTLYNSFKPADLQAIAAKMPAADKTVQNLFASLMTGYNVSGTLVNGPFNANHKGLDGLLDTIAVTLTQGSVIVTLKSNNMVLLNVPVSQLGGAALATSSAPLLPQVTAPVATSGSDIYTARCAGCHGAGTNSNLIGKMTVALAQTAIASNLGGMGQMTGLAAADLQAVQDYLAALSPPAGSGSPVDGAALYESACADCHGSLATSSKKGLTLARLQSAIAANSGGSMGAFSTLSAADQQALVTALTPAAGATPPATVTAPTPAPDPSTPVDGAALYASDCAGCHGSLATSSKKGITLVRLQNAIGGNVGGMGSFSALSAAQLQALLTALNQGTPAPVATPAPAPNPGTPSDGSALYAANCAGCHGALASSSKKGITIARLQAAIANNTGGMGSFSNLSVSDIQALVTVLTPSTPTPTPTPVVDGVTLYNDNCAGCHGPLNSSSKAGAAAASIQAAISANTGGMGSFAALTPVQIAAIETALATATPAPPPAPVPVPAPTTTPDGAALYGSLCSGCHGALASSSKKGVTATQIQTAISSNTGNMGSLSALAASQIAAISSALATVAPTPVPPTTTPDGVALYGSICAGCHGTLASSSKKGATATRIQSAISSNTGNMGSLSLTASQIAAISSALTAVAPVPTPTPVPPTTTPDGVALYGSICAGCHGALAQSSKAGKTAAQIQAAINSNTGSMGSLSTLSAAQVAAIGSVLATVTPPTTPAPTPACGSCHAIPPATGHHGTHKSEGVACSTCHGSGYSTTTVNAATHNNGVKNLDTAKTGWNATTRTCANSCHGKHTW